ncbi:MAG: hypothetical protein HN348_28715, partial [Proteobacteria bacterium]|nr:hypothetical protein [Pseudomonadota bacterium]
MAIKYSLLALALVGCDAITTPENPDAMLSVSLGPAEPIATDTMVANASISGATVDASYAWFVDGEQLSGPSTVQLDGNDWFVRGQVV